jgi:hypothetical protein
MTTPIITGSWIDLIHVNQKDGVYWNRTTLAYSDAEWDRLVGHLKNDIFFQPLLPAPFERVRAQLESAAPFVDRVVAYTVPGLMTSQTICPGLGVPETEQLYQAYRRYREEAWQS